MRRVVLIVLAQSVGGVRLALAKGVGADWRALIRLLLNAGIQLRDAIPA